MKVLYLTSRLPVPPLVKGDTLRDFYIIKELAKQGHKVTLVSYYIEYQKEVDLRFLEEYCHDVRLIKFDIKKHILSIIKGLISWTPFQILIYQSKAFQKEIDLLIKFENFDVAYVHLSRMAEFLRKVNIPKIIDFQDSFEDNMRERYLKEKNPILKMVSLMESKRMQLYEKRVSQDYSLVTVISQRDIKPEIKNMFVVPNGTQDLRSLQERDKEANGLLFMGNMTYFPNKDAALFLLKEVMPIILKEIPDLKLYIVGHGPDRSITKFKSENVIVTGFVPDIHPYLVKSRIAVAPLRYGTGMQNKILDAMVVGIPQIVSKKAAGGFSNLSGKEFLICECEKQKFADKIISLWNDFELQDQLIEKGKRYVLSNYSWIRSASILDSLFQAAILQSGNTKTDEVTIMLN